MWCILWYAIRGNRLKKVCKWGSLFFCGLFVTYAIWVVVSINRVATISVDYVAMVNEVASAVEEKDRAWPLYRRAGIALKKNEQPSSVFNDLEIDEPTWPDHEGWSHFANWIEDHDLTLGLLRDASKKRGLGYALQGRISEEDKELWPEEYESQGDTPYEGVMLSVILPQLSPMRNMAKLLSTDAKQAAHEGDATRCLDDIEAMLRLGIHLREHPLLINDLVSFAIYKLSFITIGKIVEQNPKLFSKEQFASLEQALRELDGSMTIRLAGERYFMLDLIQRMYTDDGNGDGRIVPLESAQLFAETQSLAGNGDGMSIAPALLAPLADIFYASRKEMIDEYTSRLDSVEAVIGTPLYALRQNPELLETEEHYANSTLDPYFLINMLMPALQKAVLQGEYTRAYRDGILAVLFAVQKHNDTGEWPKDLRHAGVLDAWTGDSLLLTLVSGKPLIYSVGYDLEDDGGVPQMGAPRWSEDCSNDWVVWLNVE